MKKSKGFTLVELLAVIVILAILVLVAAPAVTNIMTKSQKNVFKNDVLGMVKSMDTAFTEKSSLKIDTLSGTPSPTDGKVHNVTVSNARYKYLCMTFAQLVSEQYVVKELGNIQGYIQMWMPDSTNGQKITFVHATNGSYFLTGRLDVISKSDHYASNATASGYDGKYTCPSISIPATSVKNTQ